MTQLQPFWGVSVELGKAQYIRRSVAMHRFNWNIENFIGVVGSRRAYLNMLYLVLTLPLGVFYFVYLVTGISVGFSLIILWIGIPILLLVIGGWWLLAAFERQMAIHWLGEDIGEMLQPSQEASSAGRLRAFLSGRVTWTSLVYLLVKLPMGILAFVIVVTLSAITVVSITAPLTYQWGVIQIDLWYGVPAWNINRINDALILSLIGLLFWPVTLHITNALTWVNGWLARMLLGLPRDTMDSNANSEDGLNGSLRVST